MLIGATHNLTISRNTVRVQAIFQRSSSNSTGIGSYWMPDIFNGYISENEITQGARGGA